MTSTNTAPWLSTMRASLGLTETPGTKSNQKIIAEAAYLAKKYPKLAWIADFYTGDDIPWCGLQTAFVFAMNDIAPVMPNPLSALKWASWGQQLAKPVPGAVLVFTRTGGGHVGLYEGETATHYLVIAGNQGDCVCRELIAKSRLAAGGIRWPTGIPVTGTQNFVKSADWTPSNGNEK